MRTIFFYAFITVFLISCKNTVESNFKIDSIKESAESALRIKLDNPGSYEFVSLDDNFENLELIQYYEGKKTKIDTIEKLKEYTQNKNKSIEDKYSFNSSNVLLSLKYRTTNNQNALVKNEFLIVCDKDSIFKEIHDLN